MVKWKSDFEKACVVTNFERRKWQRHTAGEGEDTWHIYWASVSTVSRMFLPDTAGGTRLEAHQLVNHFPNQQELTRKDLMVKNIKRHQKALRRDGDELLDFLPTTYILPNDHPLFVEEFRRQPQATWIMKPAGRAQGRGIFLINKLSQVKKWASGQLAQSKASPEVYVVSRYIDNPLLVGGKKFDMRLYVLVLSYKPLKVYMSDQGFARFCNVKYDFELDDLDNKFMHLTNVAIQKNGEEYNAMHGNKWTLANLRLWLYATSGDDATDALFGKIEAIVVQSLKACQSAVINDRHCFELYGYDIIVDEDLKPWLIEVNSSPSLSASTDADRLMKAKVISDVLDLVAPPDWALSASRPKSAVSALHKGSADVFEKGRGEGVKSPVRCGSMHLLFDETEELETLRAARDAQLQEFRRNKRNSALNYW